MENSLEQNEPKSWHSDLSWKTALLSAILALVVGGGSGAGIVASKTIKVEGLTQDQADNRYLTKDEADKRSAKRDIQTDRIEIKIDELTKKLDEKYVRREVYDQNNENIKVMLGQILEYQKTNKNY